MAHHAGDPFDHERGNPLRPYNIADVASAPLGAGARKLGLRLVAGGALPAAGCAEPSEPAAISASALADRIARGIAARRVITDEIVPFPEGWGMPDLATSLRGPVAEEIYRLLNNGWEPTFYPYHAESGAIVAMLFRMDDPTGAKPKFVRPLRVAAMIGIRAEVVCGALAPQRPLFGLHRLANRPGAPVLFAEGEKTATAAMEIFPDHVAMTWSGGAPGVGKTDFRPVAGRDVIVWPDNDAAGRKAARHVARAALGAGAASARIVTVPANFPPKWDLADPLPSDAND